MTVQTFINPTEARYPPERIPFADYNDVADATAENVLSLTSFEDPTEEERLIAYLTDLAVEQVPGMQVRTTLRRPPLVGQGATVNPTLTYDAGALPGIDQAMGPFSIHATQRLELDVFNDTTTTENNYRTWGTIVYDEYTLVEAMLLNIDTPSQQQDERYNLTNRVNFGTFPVESVLDEVEPLEQNRQYQENNFQTASVVPPSGSDYRTVLQETSLGPEYMMASVALAVTPKTATVAPGDFKARIIRDGQTVTTLELFGTPGLSTPIPMWIAANEEFKIDITGDGNNSVEVRWQYVHFQKRIIDWVRWFPASTVAENTYLTEDQVRSLRPLLRVGVTPEVPQEQ